MRTKTIRGFLRRFQEPKTKIAVAGVFTLFAAGIFVATSVQAVLAPPKDEAIVPPEVELASPSAQVSVESRPARLMVPSIGIDADIQEVGLTTEGNMGVPNNFYQTGWYKYGPVPGQRGSAVISGHVDNGLGLDGVFKRLKDVKAGDEIFVQTQSGDTLRFVVEETDSYLVTSAPLTRIFNRGDMRRLNLITCDGTWDAAEESYDRRRVVYATLADG